MIFFDENGHRIDKVGGARQTSQPPSVKVSQPPSTPKMNVVERFGLGDGSPSWVPIVAIVAAILAILAILFAIWHGYKK